MNCTGDVRDAMDAYPSPSLPSGDPPKGLTPRSFSSADPSRGLSRGTFLRSTLVRTGRLRMGVAGQAGSEGGGGGVGAWASGCPPRA
jgi:hypothetical protein